jgi:hypothetical protein
VVGAPHEPEWSVRHRARRSRGVPTVTLLPPPDAWGRWQAVLPSSARAADAEGLLDAWLEAAHAREPLGTAFTRGLARRFGPLEGSALDRWAAMEARVVGRVSRAAAAVLRVAWERQARLTAADLEAAVAPAPPTTGLAAILELAPALSEQALFLDAPSLTPADAAALVALAEATPALPLGACLDPEAATRLPRLAPRAWAILAEGLAEAGGATAATPGVAESRAWLARRGAGADALAAFTEAAATAATGDTDAARSAAERALFLALELCPETRGQFQLNATLPARFGPRDVEVDLLAANLDLAVEVDGYFHFRDPEDYRRDRRKDLLLQELAHRVVRVLATDVFERLEATVGVIKAAVARRREERT